jgi:hypothetical protein
MTAEKLFTKESLDPASDQSIDRIPNKQVSEDSSYHSTLEVSLQLRENTS